MLTKNGTLQLAVIYFTQAKQMLVKDGVGRSYYTLDDIWKGQIYGLLVQIYTQSDHTNQIKNYQYCAAIKLS